MRRSLFFFKLLCAVLLVTVFLDAHFFAQATLSLFFFALLFYAGLLVKFALLHLPKETFLLQLAFQNLDGFFNVTVYDSNFHVTFTPLSLYK